MTARSEDPYLAPPSPVPCELKTAMDEVTARVAACADVQGIVLIVFTEDQQASSGQAVSLQMRGVLPGKAELVQILRELLTHARERAHPAR